MRFDFLRIMGLSNRIGQENVKNTSNSRVKTLDILIANLDPIKFGLVSLGDKYCLGAFLEKSVHKFVVCISDRLRALLLLQGFHLGSNGGCGTFGSKRSKRAAEI